MSCKWLLGLTIWRSASLSRPATCCSVVYSSHSVVRVIAAGAPAFVNEFQGVLRALLVYGAVKTAADTIRQQYVSNYKQLHAITYYVQAMAMANVFSYLVVF